VLAGTSAAAGLPWYAILCLPVLFAAGMSLLDTIDGSFMNFAYGWAFSKPVRKVYYNITITGLSVAVALIIGTVELLGLLADQLGWAGGIWDWIGALDLNILGCLIVALFVLTWVASLLIWRYARIEHKWAANIQPALHEGIIRALAVGKAGRSGGRRRRCHASERSCDQTSASDERCTCRRET
jgi:high-affinity nickel-transport protein